MLSEQAIKDTHFEKLPKPILEIVDQTAQWYTHQQRKTQRPFEVYVITPHYFNTVLKEWRLGRNNRERSNDKMHASKHKGHVKYAHMYTCNLVFLENASHDPNCVHYVMAQTEGKARKIAMIEHKEHLEKDGDVLCKLNKPLKL
jgi:hypothetical protein